MPNDELLQEIERLRAQVADAEQHGQFDTCHHQMLAIALETAKKNKPEDKPNGK